MKKLGTQLIETDRLILRPLRLEDAQDMYDNWASSQEATRYVTWEAYGDLAPLIERLKLRQEHYLNKELYDWGIFVKDQEVLIGTITFVDLSDLHRLGELGYIIGPKWWGKGYVLEAARAICRFGFQELELHRIQAVHDVRNPASGRVMEKLGMHYEGTFRDCRLVKGEYVTLKQYAFLADEFRDE